VFSVSRSRRNLRKEMATHRATTTGLGGNDHGSGCNQAAQAHKSLRFGASQRHVKPITKWFLTREDA
jgi:hypothetical protein